MLMTRPTHDAAVQQSPRFHPLVARSKADRARMLDACYEHTRERDGDVDLTTGKLPHREERLRPVLERSVYWDGEIDVDAFYQHLHRAAQPEVDPATRWVLGVALASESEQYGVRKELEQVHRHGLRQADRVHLQHVFQEESHTALLNRACELLGLKKVTFQRPHWTKRTVIDWQVGFPDGLRFPLILLGEIIGTAVLAHVRDGVAIFQEENAELTKLLYDILDEVVYDEQLHVYHLASRIGAGGRRLARTLLPAAVATAQREYPIFTALGLDTEALLARIDEGVEIPQVLAEALP